jgi:lysophospholipase L1-like esterase
MFPRMGLSRGLVWTGRLLLAAASLVAGLAVCELAARVILPPRQLVRVKSDTLPSQPYGLVRRKADVDFGTISAFGPTGRRLRPNVRAVNRPGVRGREPVLIETNALGLRCGELAAKRPDDFRVLVLGDSVTMGCEVHEHELFTNRAEDLTVGRSSRVRFVNGGVVSMDLSNTFYQLVELLEPVAPDLVVIQLYLNDAAKAGIFTVDMIPDWLGWSRFLVWAANRVDGWRQSLWTEVDGADLDLRGWRAEFVRHQRQVYGGDRETFERLEPETRDAAWVDYGLGWNSAAWVEIGKIIEAADKVCREHGVAFALMLAPVDLQVYGATIDRVPQEHFERMCRRLDLPCLDLLPVLRERRQSFGENVLYDQCHLTPTGHQAVANALVRFFDEYALLPP